MSAQTHNKKSGIRKKRSAAAKPAPAEKAPVLKAPAEKQPVEAVGKNYVVVDFPQEGEILT
nr:hypothetical protein [Elusimicrobiota bacterium]